MDDIDKSQPESEYKTMKWSGGVDNRRGIKRVAKLLMRWLKKQKKGEIKNLRTIILFETKCSKKTPSS